MDRRLIAIALTAVGATIMLALMVFAATRVLAPSVPEDGTRGARSATLPLTDTETYGFIEVPDFSLVDHEGRIVLRDDVIGAGDWTVLDFVFTNCVLACPVMSGNMLRVNAAVESDRVSFISISVDPQNDTPTALRQFAQRLGADDRWRFLKTEPGDPERIVGGLGLLVEEDPDAKNLITLADGSTMNNIVHPTRFLVFNPQGVLVGSYRGLDARDTDNLIRDLERVLDAGI